jgi:hypothetical protein
MGKLLSAVSGTGESLISAGRINEASAMDPGAFSYRVNKKLTETICPCNTKGS